MAFRRAVEERKKIRARGVVQLTMMQAGAQFLYIVSRERPDLYRRLSAEFSDLPQVTVILDRRVRGGTPMHERRVRTINDDLETLGWAIVTL